MLVPDPTCGRVREAGLSETTRATKVRARRPPGKVALRTSVGSYGPRHPTQSPTAAHTRSYQASGRAVGAERVGLTRGRSTSGGTSV